MAYILNKSNGQQLTILNDGLIDDTLTSLLLVGKNVSNFGNSQNENFVYLLENFANSSSAGGQPRSPTAGQIWFDTSPHVNRPLIFDGRAWRPLSVLMYDTTTTNTLINASSTPRYPFSASTPGDLWIDSVNKQLYVVTSTASTISLIGPEGVPGFGTTKMASVMMYDTAGTAHPVIQTILNNEVINISSNITFDSSSTNQVSGFTKIYRGITFKNYSTSSRFTTSNSDIVLYGMHDQLDVSYPRRMLDEHIQGNWYFDYGTQLKFGTNSDATVTWNSASSTLALVSNGGINLSSAGTSLLFNGNTLIPQGSVSLGNPENKFTGVYSTNITATTISATDIFESGFRVLTEDNLSLFGIRSINGTVNQISASSLNGTTTLSLPNSLVVGNITATTVSSGVIAGLTITDSGARVITTATLPFSIGNIVSNISQLTVGITGNTATLSVTELFEISDLSARSVYASDIFENGYRVITTSTIADNALTTIFGLPYELEATTNRGRVTIGFPEFVRISNLNATSTTVVNMTATNGFVAVLSSNNATFTALASSNANISGTIAANTLRTVDLWSSGNATFANDTTATNVYASGNMSGYNVRGNYGNFSNQLNATAAAVGNLTFTSLHDGVGANITAIDSDITLSSNSNSHLVTQRAIVAYVNTLVNAAISAIPAEPAVPTGTVLYTARQTPPPGYMLCDGASYTVSAYSGLYSAIGYVFGGSSGNFNVPDLRGQFIRSLDDGKGIDVGRTLGSTQAASMESHAHFEFANVTSGYGNIGNFPSSAPSATATGDSSGASYNIGTNNNDPATVGLTSHIGGIETRPTNVALNAIIKY